jgi:hypothetical protein
MTSLAVTSPISQFPDKDGDPLDEGSLYFGVANQNPITSPVAVTWDADGLIPAAQPIRTKNGYPSHNGSPALVYVDGNFSLSVYDRRERLVLHARNSAESANGVIAVNMINQFKSALANYEDFEAGGSLIGVDQTLAYAAYTVGDFLANLPLLPTGPAFGAKFDGTTDDTVKINACASACRAYGRAMMMPRKGTGLVSGPLNFGGIHVMGFGGVSGTGRYHLQATSAQFDVITTTGLTTLEGLAVHGGWDGVTSGQSGDIVSVKATSPAFPYTVHIRNCVFQYAKKRQILIERGGYSSIFNVKTNAAGLHGLELLGNSGVDACTTVSIGGMSVFSDDPFGYGIKMTECINVTITGAISEFSKGTQITGSSNRAIQVNGLYQENISGGKFIDWAGSSGVGIDVRACFGGGGVIDYNANWVNQSFGGNANVGEPALPMDAANGGLLGPFNSGQQTTAAAGSFTVLTLTVPPGAWEVEGAVQTVNAGSATITQLGALWTQNAADAGINSGTAPMVFGEDEVSYNPGATANLRVRPRAFIQNTTNAAITLYLRAYFGVTAGTIAYRGIAYMSRKSV